MRNGSLLPPDFQTRLDDAVAHFWATRSKGSAAQGGTRGNVIGGKNLDGFSELVLAVAQHCGLPEESVFLRPPQRLSLPGFFRPHKRWDAVVVYRDRLLAVFEFKSHVGSFGNNFNNRAEEALGNATDIMRAEAASLFGAANRVVAEGEPAPTVSDPRPAFRGYLMVLEDSEKANKTVKAARQEHFAVDSVFDGASYSDRYRILCERMVEKRIYDACALLVTPSVGGHRSLTAATSAKNLFLEFAGRAKAAVEQ